VVTHSQDALKPLIPVCQCVFSWGLALSLFEIVRAEGVRPFVLLGALVMVVAGGAWLLDEFCAATLTQLPKAAHPLRAAIGRCPR
jgi:hypothetical protein